MSFRKTERKERENIYEMKYLFEKINILNESNIKIVFLI